MTRYFTKTYSSYRDITVEADISNYLTNSDVKKQLVIIHHHLQKKLI